MLNIDNEDLERYCYEVKEKDKGRKISNQGGWQSNLINVADIRIRDLYEAVMYRVDAINRKIGYSGPKINMQAFWLNINGKNNYNEMHDHPGSFYAAVYYVKAKEEQGDIVFYNPIPFFSNYATANNAHQYDQFNSTNWGISPKTGKLLIFPSYLNHFVKINTVEEDRISISFNFNLDWKGLDKF